MACDEKPVSGEFEELFHYTQVRRPCMVSSPIDTIEALAVKHLIMNTLPKPAAKRPRIAAAMNSAHLAAAARKSAPAKAAKKPLSAYQRGIKNGWAGLLKTFSPEAIQKLKSMPAGK